MRGVSASIKTALVGIAWGIVFLVKTPTNKIKIFGDFHHCAVGLLPTRLPTQY